MQLCQPQTCPLLMRLRWQAWTITPDLILLLKASWHSYNRITRFVHCWQPWFPATQLASFISSDSVFSWIMLPSLLQDPVCFVHRTEQNSGYSFSLSLQALLMKRQLVWELLSKHPLRYISVQSKHFPDTNSVFISFVFSLSRKVQQFGNGGLRIYPRNKRKQQDWENSSEDEVFITHKLEDLSSDPQNPFKAE